MPEDKGSEAVKAQPRLPPVARGRGRRWEADRNYAGLGGSGSDPGYVALGTWHLCSRLSGMGWNDCACFREGRMVVRENAAHGAASRQAGPQACGPRSPGKSRASGLPGVWGFFP